MYLFEASKEILRPRAASALGAHSLLPERAAPAAFQAAPGTEVTDASPPWRAVSRLHGSYTEPTDEDDPRSVPIARLWAAVQINLVRGLLLF